MIEQVGNPLTFLAFFTATKQGKGGLSPTVDVYKNGSQVVTSASATAVGGGLYSYILASGSVDAEGYYCAIFKTSDATVDQQHLPALWIVGTAGVERLDAAVSSRLPTGGYTTPPTAGAIADAVWQEPIADHVAAGSTGQKLSAAGSASDPLLNPVPGTYPQGSAGFALARVGAGYFTVLSPVSSSGGVITIVQGDDYHAGDGRAIDLSFPAAPSLTGATVTLKISGPATVTYSMAVVDADTARLQLTGEQTAALSPGPYPYEVSAVLVTGRTVTLGTGTLRVERQIP